MPLDFVPEKDIPFVLSQTDLILDSYCRWFRRELLARVHEPEKQAKAMFEAPFVILSSEAGPDPLLNYGNRAALKLWETTWDGLRRTRGKETAEETERTERERFLKRVHEKGFIEDYQGVRISAAGRRFCMNNARVWNLVGDKGRYLGQAAAFRNWEYL